MTTGVVDRALVAETGAIPDGFKLIRDVMPLKIVDSKQVMKESAGEESIPVMRLTGVFQKADEKNANGRVYPLSVLTKAVEDLQEAITERRVMGEFDHPPDAKIHLENVSHLITRIWMEGKTCMGELEVLERMPKGAMLKALIESNVQVGISSRGIGDMEMKENDGEECYEVQPGFTLVTWDSVAEPSVSGTQLMVLESLARKKMMKSRKKRLSGKQITERKIITEVHNMLWS